LFDDAKAITFGELATFPVERGIEDKLWGPAPTEHPDDDAEGAADRSAVDMTLAAVGIDTGDLLSMLEEDQAEHKESSGASPATRGPRQRRAASQAGTAKRRKRGAR
jgi:hypothetical protein